MPALANHWDNVSYLIVLFMWRKIVTYCIGRKDLEKINSSIEEIYDFCASGVAGITRRLEGTDTSSVFVPLVFPEYLIG